MAKTSTFLQNVIVRYNDPMLYSPSDRSNNARELLATRMANLPFAEGRLNAKAGAVYEDNDVLFAFERNRQALLEALYPD